LSTHILRCKYSGGKNVTFKGSVAEVIAGDRLGSAEISSIEANMDVDNVNDATQRVKSSLQRERFNKPAKLREI
jgi:hypothetical protein